MFNMHLHPVGQAQEGHARSESWPWVARAVGRGVAVAIVLFCVGFGCLLLLLFISLPPQRLSKGYFPATFHQSLEQSLPASLPDSMEFLNAAFWHGAGDVLVIIAATVPQQDVEIVEQQFVKSKNVLPLHQFTPVLGREANDAEIVFTGHSKWGGCIVLGSKNNTTSEVLIFTMTWDGPWPWP